MSDPLIQFVKAKRKAVRMTQHDLADRAGVDLRFIRDLEQGKATAQSQREGFKELGESYRSPFFHS